MKKINLRRSLFLLVFFFLIPAGIVKADALEIQIGKGNMTSYKGVKVGASLDGSSIALSGTPGIMVDGTAMLPYDLVFQKNLKASVSYNSKTGVLVFRQFQNTVKLTLNSRKAYINKKKVTAPYAPVSVSYVSKKVKRILVPAKFVAESLGYTCYWNKSASQFVFCSPYALYYDKEWRIYSGAKGKVSINEKNVSVTKLPTLIFNNTAFVQARKVFHNTALGTNYTYAKGKVTIKKGNRTIVYTINSRIVYINKKKYTIPDPPRIMKDNKHKVSCVMVPGRFTAGALGIQYKWDASSVTSCFLCEDSVGNALWKWNSSISRIPSGSQYSNLLLFAAIQKENNTEIFTVKTLKQQKPKLFYQKSSNEITLTFTELSNSMSAIKQYLSNSAVIKKVTLSECSNGSVQITLQFKKNMEYYEKISGTSYVLTFMSKTVTVSSGKVVFQKPSEVSAAEISNQDCYYEKQFKITLPGDYKDYYNNIHIPDNAPVRSITSSLTSSGKTVLTFETSKIQGYDISCSGDMVTVKIGNPDEIYKNIVVLDPGHGGTDPGAIGCGLYEKNINFAILYTYAKSLFNSSSSPVKAYWTRTSDTFITLADRAAFAASVKADLFISMHMNSAGSTARGAETYYCGNNNKVMPNGVNSQILAEYFQNNWPSRLGIGISRGVRTANYYVLKYNSVPSILIELGFITNSGDVSILGNTSTQKKASRYFYQTVCGFFKKYPTGR